MLRLAMLLLLIALPSSASAQLHTLDLATVSTTGPGLLRVHGSTGTGAEGVPVAGGHDCDGDGALDLAFAAMQASPLGRSSAGEVYLVFGDGTLAGTLDTAVAQARILRILGDGVQENAGSEIWMDDVTGDGVGDLLIARQNHTPEAGRTGAGALSILVGGPELATHAAGLTAVDLRAPPAALTLTTIVGGEEYGRLGIWMRTGDVTGDGVADLAIGADQEDAGSGVHRGAVYVVRGGSRLAAGGTIDLANFGSTSIAGHVARVGPPPGTSHLHFGATVGVADLDGNGQAEVMAAAALNRSGATLPAEGAPASQAHGTGGTAEGTLYVAWDDNFAGNPWTAGLAFEIDSSPGARTIIDGGVGNVAFGEEMLGGLDYDDDGAADLFVADIVADLGAGAASGSAHVFYGAASLRGLVFDRDSPPPGAVTTDFPGFQGGAITGDTALHGDFDGDGIDDLGFSSPHGAALGRNEAGILHVFFGASVPWPPQVDLAQPLPPGVRATEVIGAHGTVGADVGDVLCYSAAAGDLDGDGRADVITNEMLGNGLALGSEDVGNLIALGGALLSPVLGTACSNLVDDDGDGLIDFPVDPGCGSAASPLEDPQCQDGLDNDGALGTDFDGGESILGAGGADPNGPDPQCVGRPWRDSEQTTQTACGLGAELLVLLPLLAARTSRRRRSRLPVPRSLR